MHASSLGAECPIDLLRRLAVRGFMIATSSIDAARASRSKDEIGGRWKSKTPRGKENVPVYRVYYISAVRTDGVFAYIIQSIQSVRAL